MFLVAFLRPVVSIQVPALAFQLVSAGREQVLAAGAATVAIAYDTITKHATGAAEKLVTLGATTAATVRNNVNIYVPEAIEKMRDAGAATFETVARNGPEAAGKVWSSRSVYARFELTDPVKTASWIMEHPGLAALGAVGTGGLAIAAAPALVTVPILSTVGFGAGGVQAGTQVLRLCVDFPVTDCCLFHRLDCRSHPRIHWKSRRQFRFLDRAKCWCWWCRPCNSQRSWSGCGRNNGWRSCSSWMGQIKVVKIELQSKKVVPSGQCLV